MLEGLVAWVLRTYIGEYVENLNTDQLSIGIYQGEVELENLPLRKDAFKNLDLPLEVKTGFIGKVHLTIPWTKLNSAPWIITLDKIYIIAGPQINAKYDEEEEKKTEDLRKSQQLEALEEKWKIQKNVSAGRMSSWWSFGTASVASIATNIVENLQLNINDVHVRYEDDSTLPGSSFASGFVIKSLSAQSTDANWASQFVSRSPKVDLMYKLADLKHFALYWDTNAKMIGNLAISELEDVLNRGMYELVDSGQFCDHQYIVKPVSAQAKMKRNMSEIPLRSADMPRINLDIKLETIPIELRESQYKGFMAWMKEFDRFDRARKYRKWRPLVPLKGNSKEWWDFAISSTLHFIKKRNSRLTKRYLLQRAKDNVKYVDSYMNYIKEGSYTDKELLAHREICEQNWSFEEVKILRQIALRRIDEANSIAENQLETVTEKSSTNTTAPSKAAVAQAQQTGRRSWFPGWGGWYGQPQPPQASALDAEQNEGLEEDGVSGAAADLLEGAEEGALEKEKQIEKEILDVFADSAENNTFLKRDTIFAKINFCLQRGVVRLLNDDYVPMSKETASSPVPSVMMELECSNIQVEFESRLRSNGLKFGVCVGGLFLTDKVTNYNVRPVLVAPQCAQKETPQRQFFSGQFDAKFFQASPEPKKEEAPLFHLVYERKPFHSKADYRLSIKSKPLDIVYNPAAIQRVKSYLRLKQFSAATPSTARARYEEIKRNTQAEFQQALNKFLEGDEEVKVKRWDFDIDIATPQIIFPESFTDNSKTLVVLDLGRLQLCNLAAGVTDRPERDLSDEEDEFVTPSSTPPNELDTANNDVTPVPMSNQETPVHSLAGNSHGHMKSPYQLSDLLGTNMSESMVHDKIYDKYTLTLSDLQVLVGTAQENWKYAQNKGTSKLHVIDKFSITLQLERRLLYTSDPQWPKATLAGTLPSLVLHVNEQKVKALSRLGSMLRGKPTDEEVEDSIPPLAYASNMAKSSIDLNSTMYYSVYPGKSQSQLTEKLAAQQNKARQTVADARLLLMQFSINQVSLEVQSRERSIAELQVSGVRANGTRRPFDTSLSFTVHSLLVVDAIQTYGTDFELLVASHKNLWIDSMSGSIRDSGPNSPSSPVSPHSPRSTGSPAEPVNKQPHKTSSFQTLQNTVSNALQSFVTSTTGMEPSFLSSSDKNSSSVDGSAARPTTLPMESSQGYIPFTPVLDSEALIKVEVDIVTPECPSNSSTIDTLHIANIQFNNLDFVANQQTITELLSFVHSVREVPKGITSLRPKKSSKLQRQQSQVETVQEKSSIRWEVNADFHRLNILLMREEEKRANKVATITMSEAKIQATLADVLDIQGSLDGLQLLNLTQKGYQHRKVFNVGIDPNITSSATSINWADFPKPDMYKTANESMLMDGEVFEKAFTFNFEKPGVFNGATPLGTPTGRGSANSSINESMLNRNNSEMSLLIRMASLCYTHSPVFLKELSLCVTDFQDYMSRVKESIKTAATEVAMGLVVHTRSEMSTSMYVSKSNATTPKKPRLSAVTEEFPDEVIENSDLLLESSEYEEEQWSSGVSLKLDALLQTPVIILPRSNDSLEVLVGHLGKIAMRNYPLVSSNPTVSFFNDTVQDENERNILFISIKDLAVYSLDLQKQRNRNINHTTSYDDSVYNANATNCYSNNSIYSPMIQADGTKIGFEIPIVHDTEIELTIQKGRIEKEERPASPDGERMRDATCAFTMDDVGGDTAIIDSGEDVVEIKGRVVNPLQVSLSKTVFEQILQTLDNIALPDDIVGEASFDLQSDTQYTGKNIEPSLSSLQLDDSSASHSSFTSIRDVHSMSDVNTNKDSSTVNIQAEFKLHTLNVKMTGDLGDGEQGLVDIQFQDFRVTAEKFDAHVKDIDVFLQSLVVEDLLITDDVKHRQLMVSHGSSNDRKDLGVGQYLSSSCPANVIDLPPLDMPPSLPSDLNRENVWDIVYDQYVQKGKGSASKAEMKENKIPSSRSISNSLNTPASTGQLLQQPRLLSPAPAAEDATNRLVHIKVKLVDTKSPVFKTKHNETQRYIDVDFNKLETTLNLQTWVCLLDFLGMGAKAHDPEQFTEHAQNKRQRHPSQKRLIQVKEEVNSEVKLKIQSLGLILNKPEYELAKANVEKFSAHVSLRQGDFNMNGELGSMSLLDQSPYGDMYRERFVSIGSQALDFHLHKYGTPDPDLLRDYDVSIKLRMTSICYVHTQRFVQELLAFAQNFNQLQDYMGQVRAATEKRKFQDKAFRSARISMDIEAGAPIILVPHSSKNTDVLVMDLGKLSVHNKFIRAGQPTSISYKEDLATRERSSTIDTVRERSSTLDTLLDEDQFISEHDTLNSEIDIPTTSKADHDPMTASIYGDLEDDHRNESNSVNLAANAQEMQRQIRKMGSRQRTSSLSSYYETMGIHDPPCTSLGSSDNSFNLNENEYSYASNARSSDGTSDAYRSAYSEINTPSFNPQTHCCLLDSMDIELSDIDLFSAEWKARGIADVVGKTDTRLVFNSYIIERDDGKVLKEKGRLTLQVERNLEGEISHAVPDIYISGGLSSVHFSIDVKQYKLVKGLLAHNFGEPLEQFQKKVFTYFENPLITTVLSGEVWKGICISLHLENVAVELLINHANEQEKVDETSLAIFHFLQSHLTFDSYSDQSKEIGLVSHQIRAHDTRYRDAPANVKPNVFDKILQPSKDTRIPGALQLELHYRSGKTCSRFTVLLNNMRLMGVFDWLLSVKDYIGSPVEDPWKDVGKEGGSNSAPDRQNSQVSVSSDTGIATKRLTSIEDTLEPPFHFNLNVTDTELVVVENTADRDTIAVILKATAILAYKPNHNEKPLTCNLGSLEVFSCSLSAEDETALSIIDPMQIGIELNNSIYVQHKTHEPHGLLDVRPVKNPPVLEINFQTLIIRVSYSDVKLFLAIMNSMPKQLLKAQEANRPKNLPQPKFPDWMLDRLQGLGFSKTDCENALECSSGILEDAVDWLTHNAIPLTKRKGSDDSNESRFNISGVELRCGSIALCLIDDCLDADVPLVELSVLNLSLLHKLDVHKQGKATFKIAGDYYNRSLSGWEPLVETWPCQLKWQHNLPGEENKIAVDVKGTEVLNINVTSVLIEQYKETQSKWREEYYKELESSEHVSKRRSPFVPFAIRNHTGCNLSFATLTTSPSRLNLAGTPDSDPGHREIGEWRKVFPGDQLPFVVDEREKIRHKNTHELKVHQVVVCVEGWEAVAPVSLDKVGTYFREAVPKVSHDPIFSEMPPARVVFDVTLEGSARKVITVRSALLVDNQLEDDIQVRLESTLAGTTEKQRLLVPSKCKRPVPLASVHSKIWFRPANWSLDWCNGSIRWTAVKKVGEVLDINKACDTIGGEKNTYRFCISIYRQQFPMKVSVTGTSKHGMVYDQPGHVITLVPPVRIENLLPVDVTFYLKGTEISGRVGRGQTSPVVAADLSKTLVLGVNLENFFECRELIIPIETIDYHVKLRIYDEKGRLLELLVHILAGIGGSLTLTIGAPYWLVNRTGLPFVYKQDGAEMAAGQFEEHEVARSVTPLLFCYADKESRGQCCMRLGKRWLGEARSNPVWCHSFSLERGCGVRPVHVKSYDNCPDKVYNIGIDVRQGRGRYCQTNIVTFSPRYQLDNRSSRKLIFAQRHIAHRGQTPSGDYTSALSNCMVPFHWPRVDKDQLLCVKMEHCFGSEKANDFKVCDWSGGFKIDQVNSFHVNMRDETNVCRFLRVDVVLQGATFYVVFSDAETMPPPYRIDNFSEVQITFYQTKVIDDHLRTIIKPNSSVPYAWDEPVLPPHISLSVQGGSSATYNMDVVRDGDQLFYENFIYIASTVTFKGRCECDYAFPREAYMDLLENSAAAAKKLKNHNSYDGSQQYTSQISPELEQYTSEKLPGVGLAAATSRSWSGSYNEFFASQELVLEVSPATQKVMLRKKELGNRFQLWRMTSAGLLQHEGTSTPRDPRKHSHSAMSSGMVSYVLDVQDIALQPGRETNLMLRKPDERRTTTQTWKFTEDGRLCPKSSTQLCVQTKEGVFGLREGSEVILGPSPPVLKSKDVPLEMQISRQRMRPGSGLLSVKVVTDGPTRVLQITDIKYQQYQDHSFKDDWIMVDERRRKPQLYNMETCVKPKNKMELEINIVAPAGLGISFVNKQPEELMYLSLHNISVNYTSNFTGQVLDLAVSSLQIDNQLLGTNRPILLYITPSKQDPEMAHLPALQLSTHIVPNNRWNAHIFRHLLVNMKSLTVQLEERMLWKLVQFLGVGQTDVSNLDLDESTFESHRAMVAASSSQFARYYFGTLKIQTGKVSLSVITANELAPDLKAIKRAMRLPLVTFDDAKIELDPFSGVHIFETSALLLDSIRIHYTEELKSQAAKMLGSVDFLGNPLGLFNDVTEGLSGLLNEGNIGGLVKNVTHGAFDSTAKVTSTLSDGITFLSGDNSQLRKRQKLREDHAGSGGKHMLAAFKGLGIGVLGGVTSIFTQTYSGAKNEGLEGLATGVMKGVVGTVTRPVAGVLDFASETASAVRDTSRGSSRKQPPRVRKTRCSYGPGGLLPAYSEHHAKAQEFLLKMNKNNYGEMFIAFEGLRYSREDCLRVLISSNSVYFLSENDSSDQDQIMLKVNYDEIFSCRCIPKDKKFYIEIIMKKESECGSSSSDPKKRPIVRCDSESIAMMVVQQINYAKTLYDEKRNTLPEDFHAKKL